MACLFPRTDNGPSTASSAPTRPSGWHAGGGLRQHLYNVATEEQKKWAVLRGRAPVGSTMVLTEPDAGSDVGAGRPRPSTAGRRLWHIEGVKRFITSGDSDDMFENIFHLVLARPEVPAREPRVSHCSSSRSSLRLRDGRTRRA